MRVLLVDDHASMRAGLAMVLSSDPSIEVVGQAGDGPSAVRLARECDPDVVFLDIEMPGWNGVRTTAELLRVVPQARILVLTMFDLDEYVAGAMQAGAHGFLLKTADARELIAAAHACAAGEAVLTPAVLSRVAARFVQQHGRADRDRLERLTEREIEVLRLMCQGLSNGEIADRLVVEVPTVKSHVAHILHKLSARDRLQAVVHAYRVGLV